ncbi:MAG: hypothetical protein ABI585_06470 [Betaproteobacteria bacterium]
MASRFASVASLVACLFAFVPLSALADVKTVCTITVNSPDERETLRRHLPADRYEFVELVERDRPDWLASSCRKGVRCDVLVISGHFDGGTEFYTDRLDQREYLPVDELERASCSDSCPGLFSQLKEVYLFGCNTLNAEPMRSASPEIGRSLLRAGYSAADAELASRLLAERHGESNRDRMRHIFKDVPTIYGFSGKAPLGRYAAPVLERYLQAGGADEIATGKPSASLLGLFARVGMTATPGTTASDPDASFRQDACRFSDDRLSAAGRTAFVHELLRRPAAEVRMFLDPIERWAKAITDHDRASDANAAALAAIAEDREARERYLALARDADDPAVRVRMMALAQRIGWLTLAEERSEFARMIVERDRQNALGRAEVELACARGGDRDVSAELARQVRAPGNGKVALAAVQACLGSVDGHARVLRALVDGDDADAGIAQLYLHHRPIVDADELRAVAAGVARMPRSDAQVRALDTLATHRLSDRDSLAAFTTLFPQARSLPVQRAIAGILIRADHSALARADLAKTLKRTRIKSPDGADMIDVLIRRLEMS